MNQELDALNSRKMALEDELAMSQVKKEAVVLYDQLREVEDKRDQVGRENSSAEFEGTSFWGETNSVGPAAFCIHITG